MAKEIRQADSLTDAERHLLFDWGDDIFGAASLNLRWRPKDVHFLLYLDGTVVSHVGALKHVVTVAGQPVTVGGVGGVVTVPEAQKRGFARELMRQATSLLVDWRVDAGLLFCLPRMFPFYESQGWQVVEQTVLIDQPSVRIASPLEVMVLPLDGRPWPDGEVELNSFPW